MIYFTDAEIDQLITDDAPLGDLTTRSLGISDKLGSLEYVARSALTLSGTEEIARLANKLALPIQSTTPSGSRLKKGDSILKVSGAACGLHQLWRAGLTMLEFASGIASRTSQLCETAQAINPDITIAGTRKHPPYLKKVALKALISGGGTPHRIGLSDSVLIFSEHLRFLPDPETAVALIRKREKENKIVVEAHTIDEAIRIAKAGPNAIQMDKQCPEDFKTCVEACKSINPHIVMIAAGGVNPKNAAAYAAAGADVLVTSWMYFSPPANIGVKLLPALLH